MKSLIYKAPKSIRGNILYAVACFAYNIFMDVISVEIIDENTAKINYNEKTTPDHMKR